MAETAGVFISYRQADSKAWAVLLRDDLVEQFGPERIFLDRDSLRAGSWREQIEHNLHDCTITLLVIGRGWLDARNAQGRRLDQPDDVHRNEVLHALQRPGMTLIPVLVDDAQPPPADALPAELRALAECQARRLSDQAAHREVDVRALVDDIERLGGRRRTAKPAPALRAGRCSRAHGLRHLEARPAVGAGRLCCQGRPGAVGPGVGAALARAGQCHRVVAGPAW